MTVSKSVVVETRVEVPLTPEEITSAILSTKNPEETALSIVNRLARALKCIPEEIVQGMDTETRSSLSALLKEQGLRFSPPVAHGSAEAASRACASCVFFAPNPKDTRGGFCLKFFDTRGTRGGQFCTTYRAK